MPKVHKIDYKFPFAVFDNVEYVLRDAQGNIKKLWDNNPVGELVMRFFRWLVPNPIDPETNQVKPGLFNHLAAYGIRISLFGSWVDKLVVHNGVPNAGLAFLASRFGGAGSEAAAGYIGFGIGTTAFANGNTALETERTAAGGASAVHAITGTNSRVTTTTTDDTAQITGSVAITATMALTESGVFNAATAGTMANRQVFSAVNVANGDTFQATHKFVFARP